MNGRKLSLTIEFGALAILIGSMAWLGQLKEAGEALALWQLLIPMAASFFVIAGFIGNMYFRWVNSTENKQATARHKLFFGLLALSLLVVWGIAAVRTLQSLNIA